MTDDILTIEEVAKYLRVSERTVYDWAQKGEIPSGKIGTVWRFKKSEIEKWVNDRLTSSARPMTQSSAVQVKNILSPDRIVFLNHSTKHDALVALAFKYRTSGKKRTGTDNRDFEAGRAYVYRHRSGNSNSSCTPCFRYGLGYGCGYQ